MDETKAQNIPNLTFAVYIEFFTVSRFLYTLNLKKNLWWPIIVTRYGHASRRYGLKPGLAFVFFQLAVRNYILNLLQAMQRGKISQRNLHKPPKQVNSVREVLIQHYVRVGITVQAISS